MDPHIEEKNRQFEEKVKRLEECIKNLLLNSLNKEDLDEIVRALRLYDEEYHIDCFDRLIPDEIRFFD